MISRCNFLRPESQETLLSTIKSSDGTPVLRVDEPNIDLILLDDLDKEEAQAQVGVLAPLTLMVVTTFSSEQPRGVA